MMKFYYRIISHLIALSFCISFYRIQVSVKVKTEYQSLQRKTVIIKIVYRIMTIMQEAER